MADSDWHPSDSEPESDQESECDLEEEDLSHYTTQKQNLTRGTRKRKRPKRFHDETFIKGANNTHTVGREVDPYERDMSTED